jgi:Gas vesicle synthesis protein GvpL/GvpF
MAAKRVPKPARAGRRAAAARTPAPARPAGPRPRPSAPRASGKVATINRPATRKPAKAQARPAGSVAAPPPARRSRRARATAATDTPPLGRYVYCIVRSSAPLPNWRIGLGQPPSEVTTVNFRDLAAVVSHIPLGVLDATRENVLAHQRVNETVMESLTVLPMSFGTVFRTDDDIIEFLRAAYDAFADVINKMADKLEFGLKVLWDRDAIIEMIEVEDESIRRLKGELSALKGSTYFARMQYGRMVDAALEARSERYVVEIFEALRGVAVASRSNKPIGDKMIMNAAFLVSREGEAAFDARVKALGALYDKLTFKYTGPWPPYNFVNIRLKLERA